MAMMRLIYFWRRMGERIIYGLRIIDRYCVIHRGGIGVRCEEQASVIPLSKHKLCIVGFIDVANNMVFPVLATCISLDHSDYSPM